MIPIPSSRAFRAATAGAAGSRGRVPAPVAGDQGKFLRGDATWGQGATNYIGGSAGNAVPATAAAAGDFYVITSAGTSQGKTWAIGDWAIYNGSSGSWTQITGWPSFASVAEAMAGTITNKAVTPAGLEARSLQGIQSRKVRDCLFADGSTSNRCAYWALGSAGAVAGAPLSIPFELDVPTANGSAVHILASFNSAITGTISSNAWSLNVAIDTTGELTVSQIGSSISHYRLFTYTGFRAAYSGLKVRGMVVFASPDTTTAPVIYLQGVDVSASFALTTAGTPPNWVSSSLVATYFVAGHNMVSGRFQPHSPIIGGLTAAEVLEWTQTGRLPTWCELATGTMVPFYTSSFSAGDDSWASTTATDTGNIDSVGGEDDWLRATSIGSGATDLYRQGLSYSKGMKVRLKARVRHNSATVAHIGYGYAGGAGSGSGFLAVPANTTTDIDVVMTVATDTGIFLRFVDASGNSLSGTTGEFLYVKNVTFSLLGPIFKPVIQPIPVIADAGSNKLAGVLATGVTAITHKKDWVIQAQTNTNGNQQLLGASLFSDSTRHVIDDWCMNTTGTPTVTAGSASAGAQYKASGALAATRNLISLVTRVLGTANLWCGSNDGSTIYHTVRGHVVD